MSVKMDILGLNSLATVSEQSPLQEENLHMFIVHHTYVEDGTRHFFLFFLPCFWPRQIGIPFLTIMASIYKHLSCCLFPTPYTPPTPHQALLATYSGITKVK